MAWISGGEGFYYSPRIVIRCFCEGNVAYNHDAFPSPLIGVASAAYNVTSVKVSMYLNPNTSAHVNETIQFLLTNQSVKQYQTNRIALNLTLSQWQQTIRPAGSGST